MMQSQGWILRTFFLLILSLGTITSCPGLVNAQSEDDKPQQKQDADPDKDNQNKDKDKDKDKVKDQDSKAKDKPSADKKATQDGGEDLDKAFELKLEATTTRDLEEVAKLCASAIKKGLNEKDKKEAKQLASASLYGFANQLGQRIFKSGERDQRWQYYRTQALPRLKSAVAYNPNFVEAYLLQTKLESLPGGNRENAQKAIEKAVELADEDKIQKSEALFLRASLADNEKDRLRDLNRAIRANAKNYKALQIRATYYVGKGQTKKALRDYKKWLVSRPDDYQARILVANGLIDAGSKFDEELQEEALALLDEALKIKSDFTVPYAVKARLYVAISQPKKAIEAATKAIDLESKNVSALRLRASAYADLKQYKKALDDADKVIRLDGFSATAVELRGIIRSQMSDFTGAIEDFQILATKMPGDAGVQGQLATLYYLNDQPSQSVKIYSKLLKEVEKNDSDGLSDRQKMSLLGRRISLLHSRGDSRLAIGGHAKAVKDYLKAFELGTELRKMQKDANLKVSKADDGVLNNLAWVLATSPKDNVRNGNKAIKYAEMAAKATNYQKAHILSTLASGYAEEGDFETAIEWIEKALEINRAEAKKATDKTETDKQFKSLNEELTSYKNEKPWRELNNVEKEKAEKAAKAKKEKAEKAAAEKKAADKDDDNDKDDDKAADKDNDKDDGDKEDDDGVTELA